MSEPGLPLWPTFRDARRQAPVPTLEPRVLQVTRPRQAGLGGHMLERPYLRLPNTTLPPRKKEGSLTFIYATYRIPSCYVSHLH